MEQRRETYRLVAIAAIALAILLVLTAGTQLKPFHWNTREVPTSLQAFDANRYVLMTGMMLRSFILLPAIFLGAGLYQFLERDSRYLRGAGMLLMTAYGFLSAVSGWVGVVIGVPAEEYHRGAADAHAIEVLGDSLYWVHVNLITMSHIVLATGVVSFSLAMRRVSGFSSWTTSAGMLTLPLILVSAIIFDVHARVPFLPNLGVFIYLAGAGGAGMAMLIWLGGVVRSSVHQ